MRSGPLRHQVTIEEVTETRDSYGGVVESWSTFATVWASVGPIIGREYFASQQVQSEVSHKIRIRYLSGITTKMRVTFDSRTFRIESILNVDERNTEMLLMVTEAVP
jgi:SPP1 family predicted phage head-tail adaptor